MPKLLKHKQMEMTRTFNVLENIVKLAFRTINFEICESEIVTN